MFLEESWLYEAMGECYLPLLDVFSRLSVDRVACPVTLSLSPTLLEMLRDPLLRERYVRYAEGRRDLSAQILKRARGEEARVAKMYRDRFGRALDSFEHVYGRDLPAGMRSAADAVGVELMTTAATHGFLPYLCEPRQAATAQVGIAAEYAFRNGDCTGPGFWLPECGYCPGLDGVVREAGFEYFFVDGHGLLFASPTPEFGPFQPVRTPGGCVAFGRDMGMSGQVWSEGGYPADPVYREFHDDIVVRLADADVRDYIHPDGLRVPSGLKFSGITGQGKAKELYRPGVAADRARQHARHFVSAVAQRAGDLLESRVPSPVIVCAFDAELFGHWWYEGPVWLEEVLRLLAERGRNVRLATASEVLGAYGNRCPEAEPAASSWGRGGYGDAWLGPGTDDLYPEVRRAAQLLAGRLEATERAVPKKASAILEAAARELLLAQASDWFFLIRSETSEAYARNRILNHLERFHELNLHFGDNDFNRVSASPADPNDLFRDIGCTEYYRPGGRNMDRPSETQ